jgi:hypothetical protein
MLMIRIAADSAAASKFDTKAEPDPREFVAPNDSGTLVKLYAYVCLKSCRGRNWYHAVWGGHDWPEEAAAGEFDDVGIRVLHTTIALSELADKTSVQGHVARFLGDLKKAFPEKTEW